MTVVKQGQNLTFFKKKIADDVKLYSYSRFAVNVIVTRKRCFCDLNKQKKSGQSKEYTPHSLTRDGFQSILERVVADSGSKKCAFMNIYIDAISLINRSNLLFYIRHLYNKS